jgi:acyl carrier protein
MTDVRRGIFDEIAIVLQEAQKQMPAISETTPLAQGGLGLDSMDFAVLVVRLEQRFQCDPFNSTSLERFPTTVGELVDLYSQAVSKLAA